MTRYEIYILLVCIVVFTLLTALLTGLIWYIVKLLLRSIKGGFEDEKIKIEYFNAAAKRKSKALSILDKAFSAVIFVFFFAIFIGSMFVNVAENTAVGNTPRLQVVASESMSKAHPKNTYIKKNNLTDQFDMFDVIVTYQLPAESELKQYDIVVYEIDGTLVIHRIVNIEEPNEKHPNERHFLLQGDNVDSPDKFPVLYSQMRGIYRGDHTPFVGSIVMFLQSPAGYLCLILVLFSMIASPIVDKILLKARRARMEEILALLSAEREDLANADGFDAKLAILAEEYHANKKRKKANKSPKPKKERKCIFAVFSKKPKECPTPVELPTEEPVELLPQEEAVVPEEIIPEEIVPEEAPQPVEESSTAELNPYLLGFDPFIGTLTIAERREFLAVFLAKPLPFLPEFKPGADNSLFFRKFFVHLGELRNKISDSLMAKIYKYTVTLNRTRK